LSCALTGFGLAGCSTPRHQEVLKTKGETDAKGFRKSALLYPYGLIGKLIKQQI